MLNDLWFRLQSLFHRDAQKHELEEELRQHLECQAAKYVKQGLPPDEAARRARLDFGSVEQVSEHWWAARGVGLIESTMQDVHYALRSLLRSPGFSLCALLTLALGIGANTAIFTVVNGVLLNPLPYPNPQELVTVRQNESLQNVYDIRRDNRTFSTGGGVNIETMDYTGGPEPVQLYAAYMDDGLLPTLAIAPLLGRTLTPQEDLKGGPRNVLVSYSFWKNFLGSDPNVLGKSIPLSGNPWTIIGVMPKDFSLPGERADLFMSLWVAYPEAAAFRGVHFMRTYWRLKPGVSLQQAQEDITRVDRHLAEQYPDNERARHSMLLPLHQALVGNLKTGLLVLFGAVGLIMLMACANFATLLIARATARQRELMTRAALGAGNARLVRYQLTESTLLSLAGGVVGLLLALAGTRLLLALKPAALARFSGIHMDAKVFFFAFAVSLFTGIVFGIMPGWSAARANISEALRESTRTAARTSSRHRLRSVLVAAEFALALVLLAGAGLLIKAFWQLRSVDAGFNPSNLTTCYLKLPATRYAEIPRQTAFRRELLARLNALPGVQASMITDVPLSGNYLNHNIPFTDRPAPAIGAEPDVQTLSVMGDYFRTMQIALRAGRDFTPMDREGQPLVAIVNEQFARTFYPEGNVLGARIDWARRNGPNQWMTIVGVVADVKHSGMNQAVEPAIYAPFAQSDEAWRRWMTLVIRTEGASADLVPSVKKQVWSLDSQIPVTDVQTMEELMSLSLAEQRFNMLLLGGFAALALLLAAVGIYGMMAYRVSQRTQEIGVYIALGAQHGHVLRLIMGDGARLAGIGIGVGLAGALAVTRVMSSLLFAVKPTDPMVFGSVAAVLTLVALCACYIPARRALTIHPIEALRCE